MLKFEIALHTQGYYDLFYKINNGWKFSKLMSVKHNDITGFYFTPKPLFVKAFEIVRYCMDFPARGKCPYM